MANVWLIWIMCRDGNYMNILNGSKSYVWKTDIGILKLNKSILMYRCIDEPRNCNCLRGKYWMPQFLIINKLYFAYKLGIHSASPTNLPSEWLSSMKNTTKIFYIILMKEVSASGKLAYHAVSKLLLSHGTIYYPKLIKRVSLQKLGESELYISDRFNKNITRESYFTLLWLFYYYSHRVLFSGP